ncbi:MAG: cysteine desulfurase [Calditrichaeota bacterium]|nr:MAG: cysteine desulfurase [Calditrichota bacterium]
MQAGEVHTQPDLLDVDRVRADFPILQTRVNGKPLVYLDNAATTQKPAAVIEAIEQYYRSQNANIHRGVHHLSQVATEAYEQARRKVARFLNARSEREIVFVRGTTEAINLVASCFPRAGCQPGDEILITEMEHHSNIVPWQLACQQYGLRLRVLPMDDRGVLRIDLLDDYLTDRTRLMSVVHVSNSLGTVNPIKEIIARAHARGVAVLVDAAQSVAHFSVDVQTLDCDFLAFSGHKLYGPTGIGVLYGRENWLEKMPPYQGGGDMIRRVTFEETTYNALPYKFEAGTPNIAGAIGLGAALDYLESIGLARIARHEAALLQYATERLASISGLRIIGNAPAKAAVISFVLKDIHPHDVGTIVNHEGVAIRTGHHCTQPVMDHFGLAATSRASLAMYNCKEEIDQLVEALHTVIGMFQ